MNVLLLVPAPQNISPSQRFRFEHYLKLGNDQGFKFTEKSFFSEKSWSYLHLENNTFRKILGIFSGFAKRFFTLFTLHKYEFVFIHREVAPLGPPIFEWLIAKVFRKKIIYDFDDAIWVSIASEANPGIAKLKCTWKVANICRMSHIATVGNNFLGDYARQYCKDVRLIPTVINTDTQHNRIKNQDDIPLTIGWTGTYTNFYNLEKVTGAINALKEKYEFTFLIIANKDPNFTNIDYTFCKWNVHTEIEDLLQMNIGIMPLENTEIELGKCAFKAIQYMGLGIPAVVSPVGANCQVVQHEVDGFWADTEQEWYKFLELLLTDKQLRKNMGNVARTKIISNYSVAATEALFFGLFKP